MFKIKREQWGLPRSHNRNQIDFHLKYQDSSSPSFSLSLAILGISCKDNEQVSTFSSTLSLRNESYKHLLKITRFQVKLQNPVFPIPVWPWQVTEPRSPHFLWVDSFLPGPLWGWSLFNRNGTHCNTWHTTACTPSNFISSRYRAIY